MSGKDNKSKFNPMGKARWGELPQFPELLQNECGYSWSDEDCYFLLSPVDSERVRREKELATITGDGSEA